MVPSILNDSTAFWLDFEGSGLPEKMSLEIPCFFRNKKDAQDLFFSDFGVHFGVSFGAPGGKKMSINIPFFCFFSGRGLF